LKATRFTIFLSILLVTSSNHLLSAQHKNDFEAGLFNIGFGGVVGGIGAIINKKPNEKTGKVFLKGFYQGALGGYMLFESKRLVGKLGKTRNYNYVWPSKLINSAGISIIENASANRNFWERWHINFGFNRFEFYTKNKFKMTYRIMPFALSNTIYGFTQGKLDINTSLKVGSFVFVANKIKSNSVANSSGQAIGNSILVLKNSIFSKKTIISHELIHTYQYESFSSLNSFLNKPTNKLKLDYKWIKIYHKIFYTDFNFLTMRGLYDLSNNYNTSFFENEARYYTE